MQTSAYVLTALRLMDGEMPVWRGDELQEIHGRASSILKRVEESEESLEKWAESVTARREAVPHA